MIYPMQIQNAHAKKGERKDFIVSIHGMSAATLSSEASRKIIIILCPSAANAIK